MKQVTLGGERLGSGKKQKVNLHGYDRSTHDLSYVWRSTMASGTLVPFMVEVALPGDTHDIDLDTFVMTHPTIGPLFGSYKVQLDVFSIPIRLFQGKLHMNLNNVGRDMSAIKLPQMIVSAPKLNYDEDVDNQQINPSSLLAYLGVRGVGSSTGTSEGLERQFNAIPYLGYFEIFKNYYANKQEDIAYQIHREPRAIVVLNSAEGEYAGVTTTLPETNVDPAVVYVVAQGLKIKFFTDNTDGEIDASRALMQVQIDGGTATWYKLSELFATIEYDYDNGIISARKPKMFLGQNMQIEATKYDNDEPIVDPVPKLVPFNLSAIDEMRMTILEDVKNVNAYVLGAGSIAPYSNALLFEQDGVTGKVYTSATKNQEGLLVKTYQSDKFNNWINTEWIDGVDGVSAVTAVSTVGDSFTIDELNLKTKIYKMLNRIAMSDGTYDNWLEVVYDQETFGKAEIPVYEGGLIKELTFDEVVSTASASSETATEQPLGTLAGRGKLTSKHKGGKMVIKTKEHSYIMGIISLTPRVDYSQGNRWDTNLKTMNDFHKPALDEIGFQDLITDEMAFYDTTLDDAFNITYHSAGKVPAWINYMTSYNRTLGNFAIESEQMWMTLNRRYGQEEGVGIRDLTTYIDPVKFNHIFADTRRDAQNFWVQIGVDITARRKMSAKVMPNL